MQPLPYLLLLFLLLPTTTALSHHKHPSPPPPPDLIRKTCSETTYSDLCISSLQSDPAAPAAPTAKDLSGVLLGLASANASDTSAYLSALAGTAWDGTARGVLGGCAARYADARDALRWAVGEVGEEAYDYAYVHVGAAMAYPRMCRDMHRRARMAYSPEVGRREEGLLRLCTVGSEMIAALG